MNIAETNIERIVSLMRTGYNWTEIAEVLEVSSFELRVNWVRYIESLTEYERKRLMHRALKPQSVADILHKYDAYSTELENELKNYMETI